MDQDAVFSSVDVGNIYEVPLRFYEEGFDQKVAIMLRLPARNAHLEDWKKLVYDCANPQGSVTIAIVGKYVDLKEAYKSLHEALIHGGVANRVSVNLRYVNSENVDDSNVAATFAGCDGILVPGGFGYRGVEGKIAAIRYARENRIPFFGICLGMQCAVIEFARHVAGLEDANSEEFDPLSAHKVIYLMTEWFDFRTKNLEKRDAESDKGGTMRLGAYPCKIIPDTRAFEAYGKELVEERHRHRYEFNNAFKDLLEEKGMVFSGTVPRRLPDGDRGTARPSLVPGLPVPSRVQVPSHGGASPVPRIHQGCQEQPQEIGLLCKKSRSGRSAGAGRPFFMQ